MGVFIRMEQIPVWMRWVQYLCAAKYALNLAMLVEFDPDLAINDVNRFQFETLLEHNDVSKENAWVYALVLIAIFAGFRLISLILLNEKAKAF